MERISSYLIEGHSREGLLYFLFELFPNLIRLAVGEFRIGGCVREPGRSEALESAIERRDDILDGDGIDRSGESVSAAGAFLG